MRIKLRKCAQSISLWIRSRHQAFTSIRKNRYRLQGLNYQSQQLKQVLRRMHAYEEEIKQVHNLNKRLAIAAKIESLHQVAVSLDAMMDGEEGANY